MVRVRSVLEGPVASAGRLRKVTLHASSSFAQVVDTVRRPSRISTESTYLMFALVYMYVQDVSTLAKSVLSDLIHFHMRLGCAAPALYVPSPSPEQRTVQQSSDSETFSLHIEQLPPSASSQDTAWPFHESS